MKTLVLGLLFASLTLIASGQVSLDFSTAQRGPLLGDLHYGLFYEEINHGGDGGLYAELVRNRSFEDNVLNPDCWWGLGGMQMELVTTGLLNAAQGTALKLTVNEYNAGIRNEGFWGMNIVEGEEYTLTFWAKTDGSYRGKLWAELQNDGFGNLGRTEFEVRLTDQWQKFSVKIKATASETKGWLAIKGLEPMVVYLDVVSLMPPTFKNRENGCRRDLAEMLAAVHPRFLRFPGGCYIEGTWRDGHTNRFKWKETIGPIETRPGHMNVNWGYRVSDGLGFHELLQLAEDLGAEPLFVCNIGLGHGWSQPYNDLNDYIQEALDALEYANGDASTPWGKRRIENGHPEPFGLRLLEIGNENYNFVSWDNGDQSDHYAERYAAFYDAIKARYPDVVLIGNVESWATDTPSWRNGNAVEVVDEHYYRSTEWFRQQYSKYDHYNREGYRVYAGEYAVTSDFGQWGNLHAALAEAVYMAGMERNSDVCIMASYAPILCNESHPGPWMPDMIRFNAASAFGTPSYWVQQMMGSNVGHQNITWTERNNTVNTRNTAFALSSWATQVAYDNVRVKDADGTLVYATGFSDADEYTLNWNPTGGQWSIEDGELRQTDAAMLGQCNVCYNPTGDNCTIELDARKISGSEGFLIAFSYNDPDNYTWWNLGGWNNSRHAVEQCVDGRKTTLSEKAGSLKTGVTYHLKIVKSGERVYCYVDDSLYHEVALPDTRRIYTCAALNEAEDTLIVKLINTANVEQETALGFRDFRTKGRVTQLQLHHTSGSAENVMQNQKNVVPKTTTFSPQAGDGHGFALTVPAYSLTILRIPVCDVAPEETEPIEDPDGWVDITDRLTNADFAQGQNGWMGNFTNAPGTVAEFFSTTFYAYQVLTQMPAGEYRFEVDGFYRNGGIAEALSRHADGSETLLANLFVRLGDEMTEAPFVSLYDARAPYVAIPSYTYPDNMTAANIAFNLQGAYKRNSVQATAAKDDVTLRVGFRKTVACPSDWTCFDNVRLYYRPLDYTGIRGVVPTAEREGQGSDASRGRVAYDLSGRPARQGQGLRIVDGKKMFIK